MKDVAALGYHEINHLDSSYLYGVSSAQFESHVALVEGVSGSLAHSSVQITIDDGHKSGIRYAAPCLNKFGIKGIFFVTAGWTGIEREYMDWHELAELAAMGHQIQSHGWSHRILTTCSDRELRDELERARKAIEDQLGNVVDSISMPHGRWDERVLKACAETGYRRIYTSHPARPKRIGSISVLGRMIIKRTTRDADILNYVARKRRSLWLAKSRQICTLLVRNLIGERAYHNIWRCLARDMGRDGNVLRPNDDPTVLYLISTDGYYGAENMLVTLCRALAAHNCRTTIGVFDNSHNSRTDIARIAQAHGIAVELIPCRGRFDLNVLRRIRSLSRRCRANIIHTHGFKANFYAALSMAFTSVPLVATYHSAWPDRGIRLYLYHFLDRIILRRFDVVVAVSDKIRASLLNACLGKRKIVLISNGIDLNPYRSKSLISGACPEARTGKRKTVGLVARLAPVKGQRYLLEAAPAVLAAEPETIFILAGDGPDRRLLEDLAERLHIETHVIFGGYIADIPAFMQSIDIFVLPSISEGLPLALIEALAAGKAVIATNVGDVPKLVDHDETGLLIERANTPALADALLSLLTHPEKCAALGEGGRHRVFEEFSSEAMARNYKRIYMDALSPRPAQRNGLQQQPAPESSYDGSSSANRPV